MKRILAIVCATIFLSVMAVNAQDRDNVLIYRQFSQRIQAAAAAESTETILSIRSEISEYLTALPPSSQEYFVNLCLICDLNVGVLLVNQKDYKQGVSYLESAMTSSSVKIRNQTEPFLVSAYDGWSGEEESRHNLSEAIALKEKMAFHAQRIGRMDRYAKALIKLAQLYESNGDREIASDCLDNALKVDASPETRALGESLIQKSLADIPLERTREITRAHLLEIENGKRDFRF